MSAKLGVVEFFGGSPNVGQILAIAGMDTNYGRVITISGSLVQVGSGTSQSSAWMYDHQLSITRAEALTFDWPTGVLVNTDSYQFTHSGVYPNNGVINLASTSGFAVFNGTTVNYFGR